MSPKSILFKLLSLILGAFALTAISVLIVVDNQLSKIIDDDQSRIYVDKLDVIWESLNRVNDRLQKTGRVEAYAEGFKSSSMEDLRQAYYKKLNNPVYLFIIDAENKVVMHPDIPAGEQFTISNDSLKFLQQQENGELELTYNGKKYWAVFKHFHSWGWVMVFTVPVEIKYLDAFKIRNMLVAVIGGISFLILIMMWLLIRKVTNPITGLIKGTREVAQGNYSRTFKKTGVLEVDLLARDFNDMATSIKSKILDLNSEIEMRKQAEAAFMESEERYKHFFEHSLTGLLRSRISDGMIIDINATAASYLGLPAEQIINKIRTIDLYSNLEHRNAFLTQLKKDSVVPLFEAELSFADREPIMASFSAKAYPDQDYVEISVIDISARKIAELNLLNSKALLVSIINGIADPIFVKDAEHKWLVVNDALCELMGYSREELIGKSDYDFFPKEQADIFWEHDNQVLHSTDIDINEEVLTAAEGLRIISTIKTSFTNPMTGKPNLVGTIRDITRQKQIEKTLRRAQKMDAVGQLTGGIAHDFNNILGIIMGNLNLLKRQILDNEKAINRVEVIQKSAQRAADLTQQLLGFSRKEPSRIEMTNINQLLVKLDNLIKRSVTPEIEVEQLYADNLWLTEIDPGDFEDALLNLILNARDAMLSGGQLTLETSNCTLDEAYCVTNPGANPGDYIKLTVSDNGTGIPKDLIDRVYEPFFTTKDLGKGTGLGLSMVYGFANRSGGSVKVYSEPDIGTAFRLYLPRTNKVDSIDKGQQNLNGSIPKGNEILLVVDDEPDLLEIARESLAMLGYQVLTANDGIQALDILDSEQSIDLLFSDVVMPGGINGYELAELAQQKYPHLKILLTSGYTQKVVARNGQARFDSTLLSKPYSQLELAQRLRMILDKDIGQVE